MLGSITLSLSKNIMDSSVKTGDRKTPLISELGSAE